MKGIYEFYWDCGRQGNLSSTFIADSAEVEFMLGKEVYFGEVLGKHSEIYGTIDPQDITLKTDNQDFIRMFEDILGESWSTEMNPFEYFNQDGQYDDETDDTGEDE